MEDARRETTSWQWAVYLVLALMALATLIALLSGVIDDVFTSSDPPDRPSPGRVNGRTW